MTPEEAKSVVEHVVEAQTHLPAFNAPTPPPGEMSGNSKRWFTKRNGDRVERRKLPTADKDGTFDRRMERITEFPISRLRAEPFGWSEPFIDGTPLEGSVEPWADQITAEASKYRMLPTTEADADDGRALIGYRIDDSPFLFPHKEMLIERMMTSTPYWQHADIHAGNILITDNSAVLLDHEWMSVMGPAWSSIPTLTGFMQTPWPMRWKMLSAIEPADLLLAYACRFRFGLEPGQPGSGMLRDAVTTLIDEMLEAERLMEGQDRLADDGW